MDNTMNDEFDIDELLSEAVPSEQRNTAPTTDKEILDAIERLLYSDQSDERKIGMSALNDYCREILATRFLTSFSLSGRTIYEITDDELRIVRPIFNDAVLLMMNWLKTGHDQLIHKVIQGLKPNQVKTIVEDYLNSIPPISTPRSYTKGPCTDGWTLHCGPEPDEDLIDLIVESGFTNFDDIKEDIRLVLPAWTDILERLSDPDAFLSWVWGTYTGEYKRRRAVWIHGEAAQEGKSTILHVIGDELFGRSGTVAINNALTRKGDRFLLSTMENAAMVMYPDCNNKTFTLTEVFKTMTSAGTDRVPIEHKGKTAYTSELTCKLMVASNFEPDVLDEEMIKSRLLYMTIDPWNPDVRGHITSSALAKELKDELPTFLALAAVMYEYNIANNGDVTLSERTELLMNMLINNFEEGWENKLSSLFHLSRDDDDFMITDEVYECFDITTKDRHKQGELRRFLEKRGITHNRRTREGKKYSVFLGIQPYHTVSAKKRAADTYLKAVGVDDPSKNMLENMKDKLS